MVMAETKKIPAPIGADMPRVDVYEKVIGAATYTDDIQFGPQLLHARIKRSPHPHALEWRTAFLPRRGGRARSRGHSQRPIRTQSVFRWR